MKLIEYIKHIATSANTIFEGMAITFSHLLREPITIQYPDRTEEPVWKMLAPRYRGLLEVQMDICQACKRCERACPIDCIRITTRRCAETKTLLVERFDIDMAKCMYCGLCSETCEREATGALRHTRHFEGAASQVDALLFRYVDPAKTYPMYRPPKDKTQIPVGERGDYVLDVQKRARDQSVTLLQEARLQAQQYGNANE